jgi:hypothetical protein
MKIDLTEETVSFLKELAKEIKSQNNRGTASPYFYVVRNEDEIAIPAESTDEKKYYHHEWCESYTKEELIDAVRECHYDDTLLSDEFDFDDYVRKHCSEYGVGYKYVDENTFLTEKAYKEHMKLNGHNYRNYKNTYSYLKHASINPEMEKLLKAIMEFDNEE